MKAGRLKLPPRFSIHKQSNFVEMRLNLRRIFRIETSFFQQKEGFRLLHDKSCYIMTDKQQRIS